MAAAVLCSLLDSRNGTDLMLNSCFARSLLSGSLTDGLGSTSCARPHIGSTIGICGPIGPPARCPEHSSGITLYN